MSKEIKWDRWKMRQGMIDRANERVWNEYDAETHEAMYPRY